MLPVIEAKIKRAAPGEPPVGVKTKSLELLETAPVGKLPGMVTVWVPVLSTSGLPLTSPLKSCAEFVPLLAIQKGLDAVAVTPHGLTSSGSRTGAKPGISETRLVCR